LLRRTVLNRLLYLTVSDAVLYGVSFTPESSHQISIGPGPLSAISGSPAVWKITN